MTDAALDPRVSGALTRYRVMAVITGTFLLLVFTGVILKYVLRIDNPTVVTITGYRAKSGAFYLRVMNLSSSNGVELKAPK